MKDFSKTNKRWVISLNEIKEYFNNNNTKISVNAFIDRRLHCTWRTFLLNTKVIFKNEYGYYKWKENIPVTKKLIDKYREERNFNNKITRQRQTTLPFPPPPHYIKDAKKMTVTVVPQGKEKEFIKSTKVAQPQQRRQFILILFWGLLTIKF